jgi:hypothetical protein
VSDSVNTGSSFAILGFRARTTQRVASISLELLKRGH